MDYVIAVRTYARHTTFPKKTYRVLSEQHLTDRLYIFVANETEKELYKSTISDYNQIVVGELGGANAIKAICQYFPIGQRIVFMDDDLGELYGIDTTLHDYIVDGFNTIDLHNCGAFTFSFLSNTFWLRNKPRKEIRPIILAGNFFGTRNYPNMITTEHSHGDDLIRSVRYIEKYGCVLVYWRAGFKTRYGKEPGGLQASSERTTTKEISWAQYNSCSLLQAYAKPPTEEKDNPFVSMKLKPLTQLMKAMIARGVVPIRKSFD